MKTTKHEYKPKMVLLGILLIVYSTSASAAPIDSFVLDSVVIAFKDKAAVWEDVIMNAASFLFWTLGAISLAWKMGQLVLTKADIGDFYVELFRFSITFGLFYWLLKNATSGENIAGTIISSLQQLGNQAAGVDGLTPSSLVTMGFILLGGVLSNLSFTLPALVNVCLAFAILIILSAIAINMAILLISEWFLLYAGLFFLGFGGSSWTSDMAINYFKTVLGIGIQLFAMTLIAGVGISLLSANLAEMEKAAQAGAKLANDMLSLDLVLCLAIWMLSSKLPPLLAGIITGSGTGNIGGVSAGSVAGAVMAGATMAGAAMAAGGAGMLSGAANVAGAMDAASAASGSGGMDGNSMDSGSPMMNTGPKKATMDAPSMGDNDTGGSSSGGQSTSSRIANAVKSMAKEKKDEVVGKTLGGRIATSIRATDAAAKAAAEEDTNTLAAGMNPEQPSPPDQSEIDDFVNKS
jgi:type IV secretion system protein TrbL